MGLWASCLTEGKLCLALPCEGRAAGALLQMTRASEKAVFRKTQKNDGQTQTHVLCGCTTFGTELKLGTKLIRSLRLL